MKKAKPILGRPPLPEGKAKTADVVMRVHAADKALVVKATQKLDKTLVAFVWDDAVARAKEILDK